MNQEEKNFRNIVESLNSLRELVQQDIEFMIDCDNNPSEFDKEKRIDALMAGLKKLDNTLKPLFAEFK